MAIHGLDGHRVDSWTAENGVFWLRDLLPQIMPTARIMTYGYNAYTHDRQQLSKQSVHEHALDLITELATTRKAENVSGR